VRGLGQATFVGHAQAFALNTVQALLEQGKIGAEQAQAAVEEVAQDVFLHASVAPNMGVAKTVYKGRKKGTGVVAWFTRFRQCQRTAEKYRRYPLVS
jgi:hypothetical protein